MLKAAAEKSHPLGKRARRDLKPHRFDFLQIFDFVWLLNLFLRKQGIVCEASGPFAVSIKSSSFHVLARRNFLLNLLKSSLSRDPELDVGEGYMTGDWRLVDGSLVEFLKALWSMQQRTKFRAYIRSIVNRSRFRDWQSNTPQTARLNIKHHYDDDNPDNLLFEHMLGERLCYSAGLFESEDDTLETAQARKIDAIIEALNISEGMTVLDIGSGWGELTRELARGGCASTGITLSEAQLNWSNQSKLQTGAAGGAERYLLSDYRDFFAANHKQFDRITCIEVLDHIGINQFEQFFSLVRDNLEDDGMFFMQVITRPSAGQTSNWINKYIYPGGYIASLDEIIEHAQNSGFAVESHNALGGKHYAETLKLWDEKLEGAWLNEKFRFSFDDVFFRKWKFFLAYSIVAFEISGFGNSHLRLRKAR